MQRGVEKRDKRNLLLSTVEGTYTRFWTGHTYKNAHCSSQDTLRNFVNGMTRKYAIHKWIKTSLSMYIVYMGV